MVIVAETKDINATAAAIVKIDGKTGTVIRHLFFTTRRSFNSGSRS
jgi:hypothetical protein